MAVTLSKNHDFLFLTQTGIFFVLLHHKIDILPQYLCFFL